MSEDLNLLEEFPPHTHDEWLALVDKQLKGAPFEKVLVKGTYEGIDIRPMYFKHDTENLPHMDGLPGEAPYVRGTNASGPVVNPWRVAQEIREPDPSAFNAAALLDTGRGQDCLNIPLDRAARSGKNPPDAPASEVGAEGLSVATASDFSAALSGIDLTQTPVMLQPGASGNAAAALLVACLEEGGSKTAALSGNIGADPLAALAQEGTLHAPLFALYDQMAQLTAWATESAPALRCIAVDVAPYRESGGSAVQEVAYALATAATYVREMLDRELPASTVLGRSIVCMGVGADFFMEIAKFRAMRILWEKMAEAFGASEEARKVTIHGRTLRWNKTLVDPYVNMLRVSTEAFSGIAGGCDSLHVGPFDEVMRTPDDFSRRIARNVQLILKDEGHFDRVVDPAGGCWYVETITHQLAEAAWKLFQEIEREGGMTAALEAGIPQEQVAAVAAKRAKNIATRKDRMVGTNFYPNIEEKPLDTRPMDHEAFREARVVAVSQAAGAAQGNALAEARKVVERDRGNPGPSAMAAAVAMARSGATLGDITAAFGEGGEAPKITPLKIHRGAEPFEVLRRATEAYSEKQGARPKIFLANMGPIPQHKPRSEFSTGFYNVGAFEMVANNGFDTVEAAAEAFFASGTKALVICSTDPTYPDLVPPLVKMIREKMPDAYVVLAGMPKDHVDAFREAGVDEFLHMRSNALSLLETMQKKLGVIS